MKLLFTRALPLTVGASLLLVSHAYAQNGQESAADAAKREATAKAAASSQSTVEINPTRQPSFYVQDNGTVVQEFRDRGKPTEIDVHSALGTNYQMTQPVDNTPKIRDNSAQDNRLPSVGLKF